MSRTRRNVPPGLEHMIKEAESNLDILSPKAQRKIRKARKKAMLGKVQHCNGMPSPHSPKGYEPWDITNDNHWAKRAAHKIIRRRGKEEVNEVLPEAEEAAHGALEEPQSEG